MLVFGTRPEAIKMAPLVKAFQKRSHEFKTIVCVSGQHREMLDQVLNLFEIKPDYDLNIMKVGQDLYDVTSGVLMGMRDVLEKATPDFIMVHGDTTTSAAAALAAYYKRIPVGHVEAGLRTNDIYSPWPEEVNRQIIGRIATYHFTPTRLSYENLIKENVESDKIYITGNTVIDALYQVLDKIKGDNKLEISLREIICQYGYDMNRLYNGKKLILITCHRRENFGMNFRSICEAVKKLAIKYPDVDFVYPMHPNPNIRKSIQDIFVEYCKTKKNIFLIEPLEYLSFVYLMEKSCVVLTDSGGIQEEAPAIGKPVLVLRNRTERSEVMNSDSVKLVGADYEKIIEETSVLLDKENYCANMYKPVTPYGNGMASEKIVDILFSICGE